MKQIKVLEIPKWIQDPKVDRSIEAIIVLKNANLSRIDDEVIEINDNEEEQIFFKTRYTINCIFEVYPDEEAFKRRSLPITMFREKFDLQPEPGNETFSLASEEFIFKLLMNNETLTDQDYKSGVVKIIPTT